MLPAGCSIRYGGLGDRDRLGYIIYEPVELVIGNGGLDAEGPGLAVCHDDIV